MKNVENTLLKLSSTLLSITLLVTAPSASAMDSAPKTDKPHTSITSRAPHTDVPSTIVAFPHDILIHLVSFFDSIQELAHFGQANRYLNHVTKTAMGRPEILHKLVGPQLYHLLLKKQDSYFQSRPNTFESLVTWSQKYTDEVFNALSSQKGLTKKEAINFGKLYHVYLSLTPLIDKIIATDEAKNQAWMQLITPPVSYGQDIPSTLATQKDDPQLQKHLATQGHIALGLIKANQDRDLPYLELMRTSEQVARVFKLRIDGFKESYNRLKSALGEGSLLTLEKEIKWNHYDIDFNNLEDRGALLHIALFDRGATSPEVTKDSQLAKTLIIQGADLTQQDSDGFTPLHLAVWVNDLEIIRFIIPKIAPTNLNVKNKEGQTPLHNASTLEIAQALTAVLPQDQLTITDNNGETPLHLAALRGCTQVVQEFLKILPQSQHSIKNKKGKTPQHYAAQCGHAQTVEAFIAGMPQDQINLPDDSGLTALHLAIYKGRTQAALGLIKALPDDQLNVESESGETPLRVAARYDRQEIAQILINRLSKDQVDHKNINGGDALCVAKAFGHTEIVEAIEAKRN